MRSDLQVPNEYSISLLRKEERRLDLSTPCSRDGGTPMGLLETVAVVAVFSDNMKKENNFSKYSGMDKETV